MEVVSEFIIDGVQYQKISNGRFDDLMMANRKRKLDSDGNPISDWEFASNKEYTAFKILYLAER